MTTTTIDLTVFGRRLSLTLPTGDHITETIQRRQDFYERGLLDDMLRRTEPGQTVVDVGAHVGNHTVFLAGVGDLDVISFEPNPASFELLERNVASNGLASRVTLQQAAAGSRAGKARLNLGAEDNTGTASVDFGNGEITVQTIDTVTRGREVACIKIDVEGAEMEVLEGSTGVLADQRPPLYIEVQDILQERRVHPFLKRFGYRFAREFNATPTQLFLHTASDYNALYPPALSDLPIEHTRAVVVLTRQVETLLSRLEGSVRAFEDFSSTTIRAASGSYRLLQLHTDEIRRITALFSELYKRTRAAGQASAEVQESLGELRMMLEEALQGQSDPVDDSGGSASDETHPS